MLIKMIADYTEVLKVKSRDIVLNALLGKEGPIPWIEIETRDELIAKTFNIKNVGWTERVEYAKFVGQDAIGMAHWDRFGNKLLNKNGILGFEPLIKEREDLDKFFNMPSEIDEEAIIRQVKEAKEAIGDSGLALFVAHLLCLDPVMIDLGFENFCYKLYDDLDLIKDMLERYTQYYMKITSIYSSLPEIDFIWIGEDIAYNSGTFISPKQLRELIMPYFKRITEKIEKPWIYHSDGNIMPVIDDLLGLGMNGIHPIQPDVMDIYTLKKTYGQKTTLVGNVDLNILCMGTKDEVKKEVTSLMNVIGEGGKYILSSSNSLANYLNTDNIIAMGEAKKDWNLQKYGL